MKIIFIRHGDPDYSIDGLTEKGKREAKHLAKRVAKWKNITDIYVSPLGRAQETASYSLKKLKREATTCDWLREFYYPVNRPDSGKFGVPWDFYPKTWTDKEIAYDKDRWFELDLLKEAPIEKEYKNVCENFDKILEKYGYFRENNYYRVEKNGDGVTLVFFCHLGVSFLIMGYLLGISPFVLWHAFFVAPTAVTVIGSEEREEGIAGFRVQYYGDTSHLRFNKEPVSAAGYFTDVFQG